MEIHVKNKTRIITNFDVTTVTLGSVTYCCVTLGSVTYCCVTPGSVTYYCRDCHAGQFHPHSMDFFTRISMRPASRRVTLRIEEGQE